MSRRLPLSEAQPKLAEIVAGMVPGDEVVLTANGEPVAVVTRPSRTSWPCQPGSAGRAPRQPGSAEGVLVVLQEDDEHLADFAEYME